MFCIYIYIFVAWENIFCSFDFLDFFGAFVFYKMRDDMYNRHVQDDKLMDLLPDS